jgi:glycosyltransferase involved in cell wall biosynthesis
MLDQITPMIPTLNEEANIERTLSKLTWAKRILIVDSGSTDRTVELARRYPQVDILYRAFDTAANQCNFGLQHIGSEWVLSMDADYVLSDELVSELKELRPEAEIGGFSVEFVYRIYGRPLRGSLYPSRVVLYRRDNAVYRDEGHTQRVQISGEIGKLTGEIYHDDHKTMDRWFASQLRYANLEVGRLLTVERSGLDFMDRLRLMIVPAPFVAFLYALIWKGCLFDGLPGWYYAFQRLCAEVLMSIKLVEARLLRRVG